ncbi:hypothetical protein [Nonomuraea africana]|uniref:Uncharacterized protein n=1 Tax=Nonomuraea africana TaxID=46171 RepID=A0ABR9KRC6_9ACTN|nr:hypothetical protein [Nonomuraea africana]MBE1564576.1 hypothetical protein [Nonomuraea africana]
MTGFEIASGAVGHEGTRVSTHGADHEAAMQRLRERGNGVGFWGDDGLFGMIAATYAECTQVSLAALTGVSGEVAGTGEAMTGVARNTRDMEDATSESIGRFTWA